MCYKYCTYVFLIILETKIQHFYEAFLKLNFVLNRTKSNQRWMKLRTTVQLSSAISSTIQKTKPPLKREDSFLKRFSTRQVQETHVSQLQSCILYINYIIITTNLDSSETTNSIHSSYNEAIILRRSSYGS